MRYYARMLTRRAFLAAGAALVAPRAHAADAARIGPQPLKLGDNRDGTLYVPRGYNALLETGTTNGGMRVDFPITVRGSLNRHISTQLGSGGPTVRVITTNGGVRIAER